MLEVYNTLHACVIKFEPFGRIVWKFAHLQDGTTYICTHNQHHRFLIPIGKESITKKVQINCLSGIPQTCNPINVKKIYTTDCVI